MVRTKKTNKEEISKEYSIEFDLVEIDTGKYGIEKDKFKRYGSKYRIVRFELFGDDTEIGTGQDGQTR